MTARAQSAPPSLSSAQVVEIVARPWTAMETDRPIPGEREFNIRDGAGRPVAWYVPAKHAPLVVDAPELFAALEGVVRIADRDTPEFRRARAALASAGATQEGGR